MYCHGSPAAVYTHNVAHLKRPLSSASQGDTAPALWAFITQSAVLCWRGITASAAGSGSLPATPYNIAVVGERPCMFRQLGVIPAVQIGAIWLWPQVWCPGSSGELPRRLMPCLSSWVQAHSSVSSLHCMPMVCVNSMCCMPGLATRISIWQDACFPRMRCPALSSCASPACWGWGATCAEISGLPAGAEPAVVRSRALQLWGRRLRSHVRRHLGQSGVRKPLAKSGVG